MPTNFRQRCSGAMTRGWDSDYSGGDSFRHRRRLGAVAWTNGAEGGTAAVGQDMYDLDAALEFRLRLRRVQQAQEDTFAWARTTCNHHR